MNNQYEWSLIFFSPQINYKLYHMRKFISAVRKMRNNQGVEVAIIWCGLMNCYFTISKQCFVDHVEGKDPDCIPFAETGDELVYKNFEYNHPSLTN